MVLSTVVYCRSSPRSTEAWRPRRYGVVAAGIVGCSRLVPDRLQEALVNADVVGELGMEGGDEDRALTEEDRLAVEFAQHLHPRA